MTEARPTSEPVPEVVGTATMGAMPLGSTRVHQSPISSKSQIGRFCPIISATALAAGLVGRDAVLDVLARRIALHIAEEAGRNASRFVARDRVLDHRQVGKA